MAVEVTPGRRMEPDALPTADAVNHAREHSGSTGEGHSLCQDRMRGGRMPPCRQREFKGEPALPVQATENEGTVQLHPRREKGRSSDVGPDRSRAEARGKHPRDQ